MCGVIDASARFTDRLTLGYREAVAISGSVLFDEGERLSGHEFHRTTVDCLDESKNAAWAWSTADGIRREGIVAGEGGRIHASYLHTHPAAHPRAAARFVARAAAEA
jgi:cobyrinic acid a,c-diamide synthase